MRNAELARCFRDLAAYLDMEDVPFKPRAYERAAQAIEAHERSLADVYRTGGVKALCEIPGIGKSMAEKLAELLTTGRCALREEYYGRIPVDVAALTAIEGIGPKAVKVLWERLRVRTVDDLRAAAEAGKIRGLPHFGERSEQRIVKGLAVVATSGQRTPLAVVRPLVEALADRLARVGGVERVAVAGSIRRRKETVGDADLLAVARKPEAVVKAFAERADVARVLGMGETKCSVKLGSGLLLLAVAQVRLTRGECRRALTRGGWRRRRWERGRHGPHLGEDAAVCAEQPRVVHDQHVAVAKSERLARVAVAARHVDRDEDTTPVPVLPQAQLERQPRVDPAAMGIVHVRDDDVDGPVGARDGDVAAQVGRACTMRHRNEIGLERRRRDRNEEHGRGKE